MIFDKDSMFLDNAAFDATPQVVDCGCDEPGPGRIIRFQISAAGDSAGLTGVRLFTGATSGAVTEELALFDVKDPDVNSGNVQLEVPSNAKRYLTIALEAVTAGTFTAGIINDSAQTNR